MFKSGDTAVMVTAVTVKQNLHLPNSCLWW